MSRLIKVEVAYASAENQQVLSLEIEEGSTLKAAILQSGMLALFPEIDLSKQKIGVFSKIRELTALAKAGDRIEIYRPLTIDPKEARRAKAKAAMRKSGR